MEVFSVNKYNNKDKNYLEEHVFSTQIWSLFLQV